MAMDRRTFFKISGAGAAGVALGVKNASSFVPAHIWDGYNFGCGPQVKNRLNQGPFPQYAPEQVLPGSSVVMGTTPSGKVLQNYGMGLVVYISGDLGPPRIEGESLQKSLEDLVKLPMAQKIYIRPNWRDIQKQPGKLDFPEYWKITFDLAKKYNKRVAFRIMLENPDFAELGPPDFVVEKVPYVKLTGEWRTSPESTRAKKEHKMPRYDHPAYQAAFRELNALLADELNGNPLVEYMDTFMYGFWGEGHSWPFEDHPFPDYLTAEKTWMQMFETQLEYWTKTPLVTNTQPDFSRVGNSEILDKTIRTNNWIRTDTIFIENTQIEALSNRPPWIAAVSEVGMTTGEPDALNIVEGITYNEQIIAHVMDVGANYWSLWNWHNLNANNILSYYNKYPEPIDNIARKIGYRVRPSWIWHFQEGDREGLVFGMVNDGISGIPGVLYLTLLDKQGNEVSSGGLDPGYPKPTGVRQARMDLPKGVHWEDLKLKAELEVKGQRYPVEWACRQSVNDDGTLTLRRNLR
ncbi:MAG: hypothetical protein WAN36_15690 [Calditrichia bacterium]